MYYFETLINTQQQNFNAKNKPFFFPPWAQLRVASKDALP
jgi:hypothetical protein